MPPARPYTPQELATRWQCSAETIRQMVKRGELPGFRAGRMIRIPSKAVEDYECQTSVLEDCAAGSASIGRSRDRQACPSSA